MGRLAKPGDPYVNEAGRVHVDKSEQAMNLRESSISVPIARSMQINSHRNMKEMPHGDPSTQTAINAILMYHLLGLSQNEIAFTLKIDLQTVQNLMHGTDFQTTFEMIFNELISTNSSSIKATISRHAHVAVDNLIELSKSAKNEMVKLKANQDIADRAGLSAETLYGKHATQEEEGFKIVVVNEGGSDSHTNINIDLKRSK